MRCRTIRDWMVEFATDGIDAGRETAFREHLAACPRCGAEWQGIEAVDALLHALPAPPQDESRLAGLAAGIDAAIDRPPARAAWLPRPFSLAAAGAGVCLVLGLALVRYGAAPAPPPAPAPLTVAAADSASRPEPGPRPAAPAELVERVADGPDTAPRAAAPPPVARTTAPPPVARTTAPPRRPRPAVSPAATAHRSAWHRAVPAERRTWPTRREAGPLREREHAVPEAGDLFAAAPTRSAVGGARIAAPPVDAGPMRNMFTAEAGLESLVAPPSTAVARLRSPRVRAVAETSFALRQPEAAMAVEVVGWRGRPAAVADTGLPAPPTATTPSPLAVTPGGEATTRAEPEKPSEPKADRPSAGAAPAVVVVPAVIESEVTAPTLVALGDPAP